MLVKLQQNPGGEHSQNTYVIQKTAMRLLFALKDFFLTESEENKLYISGLTIDLMTILKVHNGEAPRIQMEESILNFLPNLKRIGHLKPIFIL